MAFTPISNMPAFGTDGQELNSGLTVYQPIGYISDGSLKFGRFAFPVAETGDLKKAGLKKAGAKVLGLVAANLAHQYQLEDDHTVIPAGQHAAIAMRGEFWITAPATATVGQAVLCDPATGDITFGEKGAANDTGWAVLQGGNEGAMIIISNRA